MADTKISALSSGAPAQAGDEYVVARSGSNYKLTLTNIAASMPPIGATTPNTGAFTTLTTSSTVTLNGGTANGVLYLNGSKVATSGSALVFDGTNVGIGTGSPAYKLDVVGTAKISSTLDVGGDAVIGSSTSSGYAVFGLISSTTGSARYGSIRKNYDSPFDLRIRASNSAVNAPLVFDLSNSTEAARFDTSGNLGIGTASPSYKLHVVGAYAALNCTGSAGAWYITNGTGDGYFGLSNATNALLTGSANGDLCIRAAQKTLFGSGGTGQMVLDASGNLGLGVTPSAWGSGRRVLQIGAAPYIMGNGTSLEFLANAYYNGTNWIYNTNGAAAEFALNAGAFYWYSASSGTAGNTATLTNTMVLDASGNLGVGATSPSTTLTVSGGNTSSRGQVSVIGSSTDARQTFYNSTTFCGSISFGTTLGYINAVANVPLAFYTNDTERARITAGGNLLVGGTAARATTDGAAQLVLFNGTAPVGTLTNGVSLYSSSGDLNFMNSAGNGFKVGYRNLPPVGTQTGSYTLAAGDVGKYVQVSTGGSITIPTSVFAEGDAVSIYNNTTGNITITCSAPTAYIAGTNTVKTSMTLATRGVATVLFYSATACVVSGNVS